MVIWDFLNKASPLVLFIFGCLIILVFVAFYVFVYIACIKQKRTLKIWKLEIGESNSLGHEISRGFEDMKGLEGELNPIFFKTWDESGFRKKLPKARKISLFNIANFELLTENLPELKKFLQRNGQLQCILLKPGGDAIGMVSKGSVGLEENPSDFSSEIVMSLKRLRELFKSTPDPTKIEVKVIDYFPSAIVTIVEDQDESKVMFVTLNGFRQEWRERPSFVLSSDKHREWFNFYKNSFDKAWKCELCEKIDL